MFSINQLSTSQNTPPFYLKKNSNLAADFSETFQGRISRHHFFVKGVSFPSILLKIKKWFLKTNMVLRHIYRWHIYFGWGAHIPPKKNPGYTPDLALPK
jgi:hypothetical protein